MPFAKLLCIPLLFLTLPAVHAATSASTQWQTLSSSDGSAAQARHESGAVQANGKLYLLGGRGMRSVQMYNPDTAVWTEVASMPMELHHFQPVAVGSTIYVIGALTCCYPMEDSVAEIHVFNTSTNTWSIEGSMPASRVRGSAAAVVRNNIIYLLGGNTKGHSGGAVAWFDSYNPATGAWKVLPDAPNKRDHFSGVIVSDYLVAAAGRQTATPNPFKNAVAATDMYDFASKKWLPANAIPTLRAGALAGAAGDEIIVAGGEINTTTVALDTVEAMNVYTREWRSLKPLGTGRHSGGGIVLDGSFHVIAGSLKTGGAPETNIHETLKLDLVASLDFDADGISNIDERNLHGTNPSSADSDSDSLNDKLELTQYGSNPLLADTDGDGIDDGSEVNNWKTDPANADSDGDGLNDFDEAFTYNTSPIAADTDADTLNDREEVLNYQTDPAIKDTDSDGIEDGDEVRAGTDPLIAGDMPSTGGGATQGSTTGSGDPGSDNAAADTGSTATAGTTSGSTAGAGSDGATGPEATSGETATTASAGSSGESSGGSVSLLLLYILICGTMSRKTIERQIHDDTVC